MLRIQLTKTRCVYIDMEEDTFPNRGGYYVRVYAGDDKTGDMLDHFTISRFTITGNTPEEKLRKARLIAIDKVKYLLG